MNFKPNRPVRVGTKLVMTDSNGKLPGDKSAKPDKVEEKESDKPENKAAPKASKSK
jgi:hypothetical protein